VTRQHSTISNTEIPSAPCSEHTKCRVVESTTWIAFSYLMLSLTAYLEALTQHSFQAIEASYPTYAIHYSTTHGHGGQLRGSASANKHWSRHFFSRVTGSDMDLKIHIDLCNITSLVTSLLPDSATAGYNHELSE
jgi:hypothetical protein